MGLLQVGKGALESVLADQWREYFYCPAMGENTLVTKGMPRKAKRAFNTKGSDNLITNGSIIAVNEGQCMMIVQNGAIVEVSAEAGEFVWDQSTEPTIFYGGLSQGILGSFEQWKKRFTLGGDTGTDQRIYFFNTKNIMNNKFGTVNPIPYRIVDANIGLDSDFGVRCHGQYTYHMADPILFYKKVCGNVENDYTRDAIDAQLKSEFLSALQPAFAAISAQGVRYSQLPAYTTELAAALAPELSKTWGQNFGIEIVSIGVSSATISEEDQKRIQDMQKDAVYRDPNMAGAKLAQAQAEAMVEAAKNKNAGPMMAFAGMNMAGMTGGMNAQGLFQMGQQNNMQNVQGGNAMFQQNTQQPKMDAGSWTCTCGQVNHGNFCQNCGKPKPAAPASTHWFCPQCGKENEGNFCSQCGTKRP